MCNGLETIFDEKRATSQIDIFDFLQITLEQQLGPADSVALSNAYDCATNNDLLGIMECDDILHSMKLIQESRAASCRSGSQMMKCISAISPHNLLEQFSEKIAKNESPGMHPVVIGVCSFVMGVKKKALCTKHTFRFVVSSLNFSIKISFCYTFGCWARGNAVPPAAKCIIKPAPAQIGQII